MRERTSTTVFQVGRPRAIPTTATTGAPTKPRRTTKRAVTRRSRRDQPHILAKDRALAAQPKNSEVALTNPDTNADGGACSLAMSENGDSAFPTNRGKEEDEAARKELDDIHDHADPSKGDKQVDGVDRVKADGASRGAADEQATKAERSI